MINREVFFIVKATHRCHHDTRNEGTRGVDTVLDNNPFNWFRSTNCTFQITFKALKVNVNTYVFIEHCHNHAVNSLEAFIFKMLSTEIKMEIEALFFSGLTLHKLTMNF